MIIELNGLPGCGKSTVKQAVAAKYKENIRYIGVAEFRGEQKSGLAKLFLKAGRFLVQFLPANFSFYRTCRKLFSAVPVNAAETINHYEDTISIMYLVYLFRIYRTQKNEMILTDEGFLQALVSVCVTRDVDTAVLENLLKQILCSDRKIILMNCECSTTEAYRRIIQRNRNDSAIDILKGEKLTDYLNLYEQQLSVLRNRCGNITENFCIDMHRPLEEQVNFIIERIRNLK